ncbi:hypothetical protein AB0301_14720 [Microbacterium profundi]|uniref:Uncharacterized protein n=1 Tax=Microbacterium profundi TaxID=450380 RepID=A0ABV3LK75_9MICO
MKTRDFSTPGVRRKTVVIAIAAVLVLAVTGVGVYGLLIGPREPGTASPVQPTTSDPTASSAPVPNPTPTLSSISASRDPETFARRVSDALFTWDTAAGLLPLDYTSVILEVGDPTGEEQAGLASDIATYLPSREAWLQLREYATAQSLTIENAYVPDAWAEAQTQSSGQLAEGTTAITIEGTRHRTGTWNRTPVESDHAVSFTVFLVCPPTYDTCHLLRLSELDNPLR